MAKQWVLGLLLLFVLGSAPAPVSAMGMMLPVSGTVTSVDSVERTVRLGGQVFHVPQSVKGLEGLTPGMSVVILYETVGERTVVISIEIAEPD